MTGLLGTSALVRVALRRDRVVLPLSVLALVLTVVSTAISFEDLYPTAASRAELGADVGDNPGLRALYGAIHDASTTGGLVAWRMLAFGAALAALLSVLVVIRHTRAEEETGRLELVGAGVVGRSAPLAAALLVAGAADLALGLLLGLGLLAQGQPAGGAFAMGLAIASAGWVFGAVAAVTAQLTESARLARGLAAGALGVAFVLRAAGDAAEAGGPTWLSWLSPIGWAEQVRPFAGDRWAPLALAVLATALLAGAAFALAARRDLGAGLLPQRPGPAHASPRLRSPFALAWRLQRGALLGWSAGFAIAGAALCGIADSVADLVDENQQLIDIFRDLGGQQGVVDSFLASMMGLFGLIAAAYAVQATLRLRAEETAQRAEPLLATGTGRLRWACSHLVFAVAGTTVLLAAAGLAGGVAYGLASGDLGGQLGRLLEAALAQAPAAWIAGGIAVALFGLLPRRTAASWAAVVLFLLIGQFGPLLQLGDWAMDLSPFTHVPKLPGGDLTAAPMVALSAVAAALAGAGLAGFRRRDVG